MSAARCFRKPQRAPANFVALSLWLLIWTYGWPAGFAQALPKGVGPATRVNRMQAEAWFLHGRGIPGESSAALRFRAHNQKLQMRATRQQRLNAAASQQSSSGWTSLGPAPLASDASGVGQQDYSWVSGPATAVAIDPADESGNTVYLGAALGGIWKSTNGASPDPSAVSWTPLTDAEPTLAVGAIAVQPQLSNANPANSVMLVGTGEANSSTDSYYGLGILRSTNAGGTWSLISNDTTGARSFAGMAFSKIAFSTSNPNLVVGGAAGASEGILEGLANPLIANLGLYYSQDAGVSWNYAGVADGTQPTAPGSVTTVAYNAAAGQFFAALRYHGFYSSRDGANWTRLANQPGTGLTVSACPAQSGNASCPIYRGEIAVVPGRNEMYVWFVDVDNNDQGIWETTNGGTTWIPINDSGITNCGDESGCGTENATYNLGLAAVPDGGATDLYAAAINLYKCRVTSVVPDCSGASPNTFINLTHAYGCSSIAKVHPAQHGISFFLVNNNTRALMYFANDGGIYRALDGFSGLTTGGCGGSNQFDSLNQTLGPITELVSFSQAPSNNGYPILAGTQGNGAPASESATVNSPWLNVNAGTVGYSQINPSNPDEWFVSAPPDLTSGVNIYRCPSGINCHTQDFQNDEVVSSATVGGDIGAFYPPYILDPQNASELIVGTCRLWRGSSSGAGFSPLTDNFETGGSGICTGSETNLVRSLAAGGPLDGNGFSNVIYAGTDGFGPLIPTTPPGGRLWVSTNVTDGPTTWTDQTGSTNPSGFPVSAIALDGSDAGGLTAYITIMGFHVSHVWKTLNGGQSWSDFSGNLPDAPANAVLVDSSTSTSVVYVGTDVGVFSSLTVNPIWTDVGTAPGSGLSGYLPNVPVTALSMFNDGRDKWLRASTYGRGLWQFPLIATPDYLVTISNTPLTVFAGSPGIFQGSAFSLDGYNSAVNMSCRAGVTAAPPTCSTKPGALSPNTSGTPFTITVGGLPGVYTFNLHTVGSDSNSVTHDAAVTLNVVDFNLTAPSMSTVSMGVAVTSPAITFQVTAAGPFSEPVHLSCSGLPSGTTCKFEPSSSVTPTASKPVSITMTITTDANTPAGTFPLTIVGFVPNGPSKGQSLLLNVASDYWMVISNPSLTAAQNATVAFEGKLSSLNGYKNAVNLSCGSGAPPICTASPADLTPNANGAPFSVTAGSDKIQTYNFTIVATGTDPSGLTHSVPVSFTSNNPNSNFTFSITPNSQSVSIAAGETAKFQMTVAPCTLCGAFPKALALSYAGCPPLSTCSLSQTSVAAGSGTANLSLSVETTAAVTANRLHGRSKWQPFFALWLFQGLIILFGKTTARSSEKHIAALLLASLLGLSLVISCGGGLQGGRTASANPGTPPGTYYLTVTATMNASPATPSQTADLTLTVQ